VTLTIRPRPRSAHVRHHELGEPRRHEHVDLELPPRPRDRHLLDATGRRVHGKPLPTQPPRDLRADAARCSGDDDRPS
jgi:hypothetical protein